MADLSLKIENDSRVEMKIYTLQDKIELSFKVDGKDIKIPLQESRQNYLQEDCKCLKIPLYD